jgi:hypothetical protein
VYLDLRRRAEPIKRPHVVLNTAADYDTLFQRVLSSARAGEDEAD